MLVCIAGTDGSGKSTLVANLRSSLEKDYRCEQFRLYKKELDSKFQKRAALQLVHGNIEINYYNLVMAYFKYELEEQRQFEIQKGLENNGIVIMDRYFETIDFISKYYDVDKKLLNIDTSGFPKPDVYIYVKVPPKVCYQRIIKLRKPGHGEELDEIIAAANYYDSKIDEYGFTVVDGELSIEELHKTCLSIILDTYKKNNS